MKGKFYVVGTGPGDPELLTLKAVRILEDSQVWLVPTAHIERESTALSIIRQVVAGGGREVVSHHFPMKKIFRKEIPDPEVRKAWNEAAQLILAHLRAGKNVAFPTLGDPSIYSTGFYICDTLFELDPELALHIVPGISAMGASAASARLPLCLGDERMAVIPATFENVELKESLQKFDSVVLMKVHRVMDRIVALLAELDLLDKAVLVERTSLGEERISRDFKTGIQEEPHYFSTMIVRK